MTRTFDLKPFCLAYCGRFHLHKPWRLSDGRIAASNGWALVVVDRNRYDGPCSDGARAPDLAPILADIDRVTHWGPLPEPAICPKCGNTGEIKVDCEYCGGTGECESVCPLCGEEQHDCLQCDGEGGEISKCNCFVCCGSRKISRAIVTQLRLLGPVEFGTVTKKPSDHILVRFDGGVGAVCPIRPE